MIYDIISGAVIIGLVAIVLEWGIPLHARTEILAREQQLLIIELGRLKLKIEKEG